MGFFSAVKKFFGGSAEEAKETQAAAVEKETAATPVAPEEPAADTGSAAAEPESAPEPESVPAADETVAPAEDISADEAPEDGAAPVAGETGLAEPEAEAVVAAEPVEVTAAECDAVAAEAPEESKTAGDAGAEADAQERDDASADTAAPENAVAEAETVEVCEEPASADAAPSDTGEERLADMEEARPETETAAAEAETVVEAGQEAEEGSLPAESTGADTVDAAEAAGDDTAAASSAEAGEAAAEEKAEAGTDAAEDEAVRDEVREGAEENPEAAAPRRSWWQRIFGSDEEAARPEAAAPAAEAEDTPAVPEQEVDEDVRPDAAAAGAHADESVAAAESAGQEPPLKVDEGTETAAAALPEQDGPAAATAPEQGGSVSVADAALAATAAAAAAATAERPTAPALETCGLDPALAQSLILRLREAEPRLSVWLGIVLEGVEEAGDELWKRLRFLLRSLDAPAAEVDAFVDDFRGWLERMEYVQLDEFRSELQYRLTLALDMEDEEDERSRLFLKISEGLSRTREQFSRRLDSLFSSHGELDESFWEELEELFIMADLGYEPSLELVERLRERARKENVTRVEDVRGLLMAEVDEIFRLPRRISAVNPPEVVLFIGVNGVGKTTTIAKLAHRARMQGKKVMIAAADTFRAAAIEQLQVWAERVGALFHARPAGSDPASVAYEAMDRALAEKVDILFVDTAGRLQTKVNLMEELTKIRQVLGKKHEGAPHRCVLVIDATTGQNALSQAKLFKEAAGVDELILTKLDGTAKGGVAIAVAMQEKLPITYVGLGEKLEDLRPFNGADYARALLGDLDQGK